MPIIDDAATFDRLGREQAIRVATSLARILNGSQLVDFDLAAVGDPQRNLLFELVFFAIAGFESRRAIEDGEGQYFPRPAFQVQAVDPFQSVTELTLILGGRQIHGHTDDLELEEALNRARSNTQ
ncbi:hypothetical protein [Rhizobium sp. SAFR-030]|uniref:hypothetical protein n=1 Tax=Rhizobium sp. SAFR-030 TaxID=3387277 RepID=UPI003F7D73CB